MRSSLAIKGFNLGFEKHIKIIQYADDGILFLNDKTELCCALNILKQFGNVSGLDLNIHKCEGLWLGKNKYMQTNCNAFGIKWPEQIRCLGIYLGHNDFLNVKKKFDDKLDKIETILKKWERRDLSFF